MSVLAKEVWRSKAQAIRWIITLDPIGNQRTTVVNPGKSFTISPIERQLNQDAVYDRKADPFTNGTFLIVKPTEETLQEEIESSNSITDEEIVAAVAAAAGGDMTSVELLIENIDSTITLDRLYEELVLRDVAQSLVSAVREKVETLTREMVGAEGESLVQEREQVGGGVSGAKKTKPWTSRIE